MRKFSITMLVIVALFIGIAQISLGSLTWTTTVDIPSNTAFDLEFQLWDWDWVLNSYALIDNVFTMDIDGNIIEMIDFETESNEGFKEDAYQDPDSVSIVAGALPGTTGSNWMMRMDEDPSGWPTVTWSGFLPSTAVSLSFSFNFSAADPTDEFQAYLYDSSGAPLIGGVFGSWDPVIVSQIGNAPPVTVSGGSTVPIPEPSTILLLTTGLMGIAGYSGIRFRRKRKR